MATLINTVTPFLRILLPDEEYVQFQAGKLEIDEDHEFYQHVMDVATANPSISIMVNATTCPDCGEVFTGKAARASLGKHRKAVHFDRWQADKDAANAESRDIEIKSRAGYACDVCAPMQTFGDEALLALHVKLVHATPPKLDAEGNDVGGGKGASTSSEIPAARRSGS